MHFVDVVKRIRMDWSNLILHHHVKRFNYRTSHRRVQQNQKDSDTTRKRTDGDSQYLWCSNESTWCWSSQGMLVKENIDRGNAVSRCGRWDKLLWFWTSSQNKNIMRIWPKILIKMAWFRSCRSWTMPCSDLCRPNRQVHRFREWSRTDLWRT